MLKQLKTPRGTKPTFKGIAKVVREDVSRGRKLFKAIGQGNLIKVERLLRIIRAKSTTMDIRDKDGTNTYARAISKGVSPAVEILLRYNVPLGDALLRACGASYDEAVKIIMRHAKTSSDEERKAIIECRCDNDDYMKAMTPLKMAAIRNNFGVVSLLLKAGAEKIKEPKLERLTDASLKQVVEYLDIYRALASPAYLCLAHRNALSDAFTLTGRLRKIGSLWEAVNKEFFDLADQVEQFCASLLDHVANSGELSTLFRQSDDPEVNHAVAQVQKAVDFEQKAFVAHAYTQKSMSINFYQCLDVHSMLFPVLSLLTMFGYPVICLAYILVQHPRLKTFLSTPYIKLCLLFGSDLAFCACCATICLVEEQTRLIETMVSLIAIFCIAFSWKHVCEIMEFGVRNFVNYTMNIVEVIILIILYTVLIINWTGDLTDAYEARARQRHNERVATVNNVTMAPEFSQSNATMMDRLEDYVSLDWNDPSVIQYNLFAFVILFIVVHAFNTVLVSYQDLYAIWESTVGAVSDIIKFLTVYAIFHLSFALGLSSLHYPQTLIQAEECHDMECDLPEEGYRTFPVALLTLWWAFNGLGDPAIIDDPTSFVNVVYIMAVGLYNIGVLVLINTLIAMLGSRFCAVEENLDTEWKFGRTKMWLRFIRTDIDLPPPFNLIPTTGFVIRLFKKCCFFCTGCTQTNQRESEEQDNKSKKDASAKKVMKKLLERYNLSQLEKPEEKGDSIGIDDIRQLKEDFITVKFNVQTNIQIFNNAIDSSWKIIENIKNTYPTMEILDDKIPYTRTQFADLFRFDYSFIDVDVENIQTLVKYVEEILDRPDATPKLELKKHPVIVQPPPEPSPEPVDEEVILPKEPSVSSSEPVEEESISSVETPESSSDEEEIIPPAEEYLDSSLEIISEEEEEAVPPEEYMDLWTRIQRFLGVNEEENIVPEEHSELRPAITPDEEITPSEESLDIITRFKRFIGVSPNVGEREPTPSEESLDIVTRIQRFVGMGQETVAEEKTNPPEVPSDPGPVSIDEAFPPEAPPNQSSPRENQDQTKT